MGNRRNGYITENRIYANPDNPSGSDYDVAYPISITTAIIDAETGEGLNARLNSMSNNETINDIKEAVKNIGLPTDAADSNGNTLFSKFKWVVDKFVSVWTDARAAKLDNLDEKVSTRAKQESIDTILAKTQQVLDNVDSIVSTFNSTSLFIEGSVIKSVQRGTAQGIIGNAQVVTEIIISEINPEKSRVSLQGLYARDNANSYYVVLPYVKSLTSNVLTVARSGGSATYSDSFSWEIVEYY